MASMNLTKDSYVLRVLDDPGNLEVIRRMIFQKEPVNQWGKWQTLFRGMAKRTREFGERLVRRVY